MLVRAAVMRRALGPETTAFDIVDDIDERVLRKLLKKGDDIPFAAIGFYMPSLATFGSNIQQ